MEKKTYFEAGVRYDKTLENGIIKTVTELYVVDALSFAETEERITEFMQPYIEGEFAVVKERILPFAEVITADDDAADLWYKVKANIITIDEVTAKEKAEPLCLLFQAKDIGDARKRYDEYIKGWLADVVLNTIAETKYMDFVR